MAKKNNKSCIVCGEKYTFCPTCADTKKLEMWRNIYCSENCKKIFHAASGYYAQTVSIEEVKARFDACDLSRKDKLNESYINAINVVYETKKEEIKVEEEIISPVEIKTTIETKEKVEFTENNKNSKSNKKKVVFE